MDVHLEEAECNYFIFSYNTFAQLIFVMDSDGDIEVGDFIPDVGAEETVVSPDIIQQHTVEKLEVAQNQKFEDLATHISSGFETLANIFNVMMPTLAGRQKEKGLSGR